MLKLFKTKKMLFKVEYIHDGKKFIEIMDKIQINNFGCYAYIDDIEIIKVERIEK